MNYLQAVFGLFLTLWINSNGEVRFVRIVNGTTVFVRENTNNYLQCKVVGNNYIIHWAKRSANGSLTKLSYSANLTRLLFHNMTAKYNGSYVCQAKGQNENQWTNSRDSQVISIPSDHVLHVEIQNLTEVSIRVNYNDSLICTADRKNVQYRWAKKSLFGLIILPNNTSQLSFVNMAEKQGGRYICQAKSENQTYWANSTDVRVIPTSNVTRTVNLLNITQVGSHIEIPQYSIDKYLLCEADGYKIQYRWAKLDFWKQIYLIYNSSNNHYYLINASPLDEERYICQAKSIGQQQWVSSKIIYVKVIPDKPLVRITNDSITYISEGTKGAFLQCECSVDAPIEYRWVKRMWWSPMAPLPKSNNPRLYLPTLTSEVAGQYACQISVLSPLGKINWLHSSYIDVRAVMASVSTQTNPKFEMIATFLVIILFKELIKS